MLQPDQITQLLQRLEQIVFLLQAVSISICCVAGLQTMQLIIHSKNQHHLF